MKKLFLSFITSVVVLSTVNASECFNAVGASFKDAQTIRKIAKRMGWKVGKFKSIAAGSFIKSKKIIYPDDILEVCITEDINNKLVFKVQSKASDAEKALWRPLYGKKR